MRATASAEASHYCSATARFGASTPPIRSMKLTSLPPVATPLCSAPSSRLAQKKHCPCRNLLCTLSRAALASQQCVDIEKDPRGVDIDRRLAARALEQNSFARPLLRMDGRVSTRHAYVSAWRSGNAADVKGLYADDVLVLYPNRPPIAGTAAIRTYFNQFFGDFGQDEFELTSAEIEIAGSWGSIAARTNGKEHRKPAALRSRITGSTS